MNETIAIFIFYVVVCTIYVIVSSIKDRRNVIQDLGEFFYEWWQVIKAGLIFALFLLIISFVFGN